MRWSEPSNVSGLADDLGDGVSQALAAIEDGRVAAKLAALQRFGRDEG